MYCLWFYITRLCILSSQYVNHIVHNIVKTLTILHQYCHHIMTTLSTYCTSIFHHTVDLHNTVIAFFNQIWWQYIVPSPYSAHIWLTYMITYCKTLQYGGPHHNILTILSQYGQNIAAILWVFHNMMNNMIYIL